MFLRRNRMSLVDALWTLDVIVSSNCCGPKNNTDNFCTVIFQWGTRDDNTSIAISFVGTKVCTDS